MKTIISESEEKDFAEFVHQKIREFNNSHSPNHMKGRQPGTTIPLNLILKDETGSMIGGLAGSSYWEWLEIENFFIPEALRGQGIGTELLQTAEKIAVKRGCKRCLLTTFEFQARTFYERHGFYVTGKLEDYPPGSTYYWMRKDFSPT